MVYFVITDKFLNAARFQRPITNSPLKHRRGVLFGIRLKASSAEFNLRKPPQRRVP